MKIAQILIAAAACVAFAAEEVSAVPKCTVAPSPSATSAPSKTPAPSSGAPSKTPAPSSGAPSKTPAPSSGAPSKTPAPSSGAPSKTPAPSAPGNTTAPSTGGFAKYLDEAKFKELFPSAIPLYTFSGLVDAASKYPEFANTGDELDDKRELAAFLAQTSHECDHYKAAEEYAKDTYPETQYCNPKEIPCTAGKRYHGRGPIQLSWNYNYKNAGDALGVDLLNNPELVGTDKSITWQTALWYWMTPQAGKIIHDVVAEDFGESTKIINGQLECGPDAVAKKNEEQRIEYYKKVCATLGIEPVEKMSCNA
ncbi:hypothetical protein Poli38472_014408 [Pythium oligandrum]|uniref:Glycoside hydrolase family 19 catalytic domain-containing protein n=1 Tax=Pythium oligandrum TaxID=41045 RepID=A0A8K1C7D3_PYTOL|nr:hypothetical protein Poli38472_014408 [Pythium oligandrum]|eukprot:TMW57805.1 hypothetical protein Poli38472_014408 [Pythium oligandrum]